MVWGVAPRDGSHSHPRRRRLTPTHYTARTRHINPLLVNKTRPPITFPEVCLAFQARLPLATWGKKGKGKKGEEDTDGEEEAEEGGVASKKRPRTTSSTSSTSSDSLAPRRFSNRRKKARAFGAEILVGEQAQTALDGAVAEEEKGEEEEEEEMEAIQAVMALKSPGGGR